MKRSTHTNLTLAASLCGLVLVSCASGSSTFPTSQTGGAGVQPLVSTAPLQEVAYDTEKTGNVGAPAPASFGPSPAPTQLAISSSPRFLNPSLDDASATFPSNVTFPAFSTSLEFTSTGLLAVTPNQGATVTVMTMSNSSRTLQLVIPSVNVNTTIVQNNADLNPDEGVTTNLNYVALGSWGTGTESRQAWTSPAWQRDVTQFAFGFETPAGAMPGNGSANYNGEAYANVFRSDAMISAAIVIGQSSFSVDFASGQIDGVFNNWQQAVGSGPGFLPWNDVSLTATIASGTSRFSGTTTATSDPGTSFSLDSSATGYIVGGFYGPSAEEIGAVWSLSDGNISAIGGVMGQQ